MAKKKITIDLKTLIIFGVMLVAAIFAIVGICTGWIASEITNVITQEKSLEFSTFGEIMESHNALIEAGGEGFTGFGVMAAFAIMAVIFTCLTLVASGVKFFANNKIVGYVAFAVSALAVVCGIVTIITTYTFVGELTTKAIPVLAGFGAWFTGVAAVVGGGAGVYKLMAK